MIDVPMFKITLEHLRLSLLHAIDMRSSDMKSALDAGIDLAFKTLPDKIAQVAKSAIEDAVEQATFKATKEYFEPGGDGYDQIMEIVRKQFAATWGRE